MNFDDIRAQALGALDAFWESDEAPAKPAQKSKAKRKVPAKRKRKPEAEESAAPVVASVNISSAYSDMSDTITAALGGADE